MTLSDALRDAALALAGHDLARAETLCVEILKAFALHPQALDMLAIALVRQGRPDPALALYRVAVEELHKNLAPAQAAFGLRTLQALGFRPRGILDIGAYEGGFAMMAKHFFPQAPVLMIEAQPGKEEALRAVAARLLEVEVRMVLLGPENRPDAAFQLVHPTGNTSGSSLYDEQTRFSRQTLRLPMLRLDDLVAQMPGRVFDMLKIDVQGAELDVLSGASGTLAGIEVIIIELSLLEYNKGAPLIGEVMTWLGAAGFALFDMFTVSRTAEGVLMQVDGIFLRRGSSLWPRPPFL